MSDPLKGAVRSLAGLLDYQEGAVVSRVLLKTGGGNATLFAFDAGEGISEHTAPFDALVYAIEGDLEIAIAGEAHRLRGGDMLVMPEDKPHALHAAERSKMLLVMLKS